MSLLAIKYDLLREDVLSAAAAYGYTYFMDKKSNPGQAAWENLLIVICAKTILTQAPSIPNISATLPQSIQSDILIPVLSGALSFYKNPKNVKKAVMDGGISFVTTWGSRFVMKSLGIASK